MTYGGEDDNLSRSTVQSLGRLVGSLLELSVMGARLQQIQDFLCFCQLLPSRQMGLRRWSYLGQGSIGDGPRGGLVLVGHFGRVSRVGRVPFRRSPCGGEKRWWWCRDCSGTWVLAWSEKKKLSSWQRLQLMVGQTISKLIGQLIVRCRLEWLR